MSAKIKEIAEKRKQLTTQQVIIIGLEVRLSETIEWVDLDKARAKKLDIAYKLSTAEAEYKTECVEAHKETGMVNFPGGKVKQFTVLDYTPEEAVEWAVEHSHVGILSIKKQAFEKVAKTLHPAFVKTKQVPRMTLSKDLSEWLEGDTDE